MKNLLVSIFNNPSRGESIDWSVIKSQAPRNRRNRIVANSSENLTYSSMSGGLHDRLKKEFHQRMKSMNQAVDHTNLFQ